MIGGPARIYVLTIRIYEALFFSHPAFCGFIEGQLSRKKNVTITGRGYRPNVIDLGRWKYLTFLFCSVYFFIAAGLPISIIVLIDRSLYGTLWILVLAYLTRYLQYGVRMMSPAFLGVHKEMEEAGHVCGAGWTATFRKILLPLVFPSIVGGWLLLFMAAMREMELTLMLYTFGLETTPLLIFFFADQNELEILSALSVILIVILVAIMLVLKKASRTVLFFYK